MIGFDTQLSRNFVGARITNLFFDSPRVEKAIDEGTRKVLSRFGAYVRSDARQSIRKPRRKALSEFTDDERLAYQRKQRLYRQGKLKVKPQRPLMPSKPGEPPRNQMGLLKDFIFFTYHPERRSVVIGPARLPSATNPPVPEILEFGGVVNTRRMKRPGRIRPRPYMQPALDRQLSKHMPQMWRDAIR